MMQALDSCYPGFELAAHKGYCTQAHLDALRGRVPSPLHRRSFNPVRCCLGAEDDEEALLQLLAIHDRDA
jgi:ribonuclease HII